MDSCKEHIPSWKRLPSREAHDVTLAIQAVAGIIAVEFAEAGAHQNAAVRIEHPVIHVRTHAIDHVFPGNSESSLS